MTVYDTINRKMEDKNIFKSFLESNVPLFNVSSSGATEAPRRRRVRIVRRPVRLQSNQGITRSAATNVSNEEANTTSVPPANAGWPVPPKIGARQSANWCKRRVRFHPASNISSCGTIAGFGSAYSATPIASNQQVSLRIVELAEPTVGSDFQMPLIDIGFTKRNPLTNENNQAKALTKSLTHDDVPLFKDDVISYYYAANGKVHYAVNGLYRGTFTESIDALTPLWAIVIIFGEVKSIQLVEPVLPLPPVEIVRPKVSDSKVPLLGIQSLAIDGDGQRHNPVPSTSKCLSVHAANDAKMAAAKLASNESQMTIDEVSTQDNVAFRFYPDINVSHNGTVADLSVRQIYSADGISPGQQIAIRVVDLMSISELEIREQQGKVPLVEIGFTRNDPACRHITRFLKSDPSSVWRTTVYNDKPCSKDDVLTVYYNTTEVHIAINGEHKYTFQHTLDVQNKIWATYGLSGAVKTIQIIGTERISQSRADLQSKIDQIPSQSMQNNARILSQSVNTKEISTAIKSSVPFIDLTNSDSDTDTISNSDTEESSSAGWPVPPKFGARQSANWCKRRVRFHPASNISSCGTIAGFGSAYSATPIASNQQVSLRIVELAEPTVGSDFQMPLIDIGFTKRNPLTNENNQAKALTKSLTHDDVPLFKDDVISYYYAANGKVHYAVNGLYRGTFTESIDALTPLWAIVIIFGEVKSIQLVEPVLPLPPVEIVRPKVSDSKVPLLGIQSLAIDGDGETHNPVPSTSKCLSVHAANDAKMAAAKLASNESQMTIDEVSTQDNVASNGIAVGIGSVVAFRFYPDINVSHDGTVADLSVRQIYSAHAISPGQQIAIRVVDLMSVSELEIREQLKIREQQGKVPLVEIGFTRHNPVLQHITRFLKSDPSSVWRTTVYNDKPCSKDDVLTVYYNTTEVHIAINGEHKYTFQHTLDVQNKIWATYGLSGAVKTIQIIGTERIHQSRADLQSKIDQIPSQSMQNNARILSQSVNTKEISTAIKSSVPFIDLTNSDSDTDTISNSDTEESSSGTESTPANKQPQSTVGLPGLKCLTICYPGGGDKERFHRPMEMYESNGKHALLMEEGVVVYRKGVENACVFTKTPVTPGTTIVLEVLNLKVEQTLAPTNNKQTINVGFTSCDPKTLNILPDTVESLMDRPEYWVQGPLTFEPPLTASDEIAIVLSENGDVIVRRNSAKPRNLFMCVNTAGPLWAFINVYGRIRLYFKSRRSNEPQASTTFENQMEIRRSGTSGVFEESASTNSETEYLSYVPRIAQRYQSRNQTYRPLELHSTKGPSAFVLKGTFSTKPGVFTKSYVFSRHPIGPGHAVVIQSLTAWDSPRWRKVGFGFTTSAPAEWYSQDPNRRVPKLFERAVYSDYLKGLKPQDELAFILDTRGVVWLSLNGRPLGYQLMDTAVTVPLWVVFVDIDVHEFNFFLSDLSGVSDSPKLLDFSTQSFIREIDTKRPLRYQNKTYYKPLEVFTKENSSVYIVEGAGIAIETESKVTSESWWQRSYVFSRQPLLPGQTLVIQMLTSRRFQDARNVGVGLMICDPAKLTEDVDEPMSFYHEKGILNYIYLSKCQLGDELAITITTHGGVTLRKNDAVPTWLMDTPITLPLWAVVDMGTEMREIRLWIQSVLPPKSLPQQVTAPDSDDLEHEGHVRLLREFPIKHQTQQFKVLMLQKKKSPSVLTVEKTGVVIQNSKTDGRSLVFSQNPVLPGQTLLIQVLSVTTKPGSTRSVGFGLTTCDPAMFNDKDLDKNMSLLFEGGIWNYKNIEGVSVHEELGLTLSEEGEVTLRRNDETPTWFMDTVITMPVWAFLVMNLGTNEVRLAKTETPRRSPLEISRIEEVTNSDEDSDDDIPNKSYIRRLNKMYPLKRRNTNLQPLELHSKKRSSTVTIDGSGVAIQTIKWKTRSLVFSRQPIQPGQTLVIQVLSLETSPGTPKKMFFGFTNRDPAKFSNEDLIHKPYAELFQRGSVVDAVHTLQPRDEFTITCSDEGVVKFQLNNLVPKRFWDSMDTTHSWWAYVDIGLGLKEVRLWVSELAPKVEKAPAEVKEPDCVICLETVVNCALYDCGHVCMCYDCAVQQWHRDGGGFCPVCRARIKDVMRIYK